MEHDQSAAAALRGMLAADQPPDDAALAALEGLLERAPADRGLADLVFAVNDRFTLESRAWGRILNAALSRVILGDPRTPAVIDAEEAWFLLERIWRDGQLSASERTLLQALGKEAAGEIDASVADLDPLGATALLRRVPEMNEAGDVAALVAALRELLPDEIGAPPPAVGNAMLRDLGMVLSSLIRHGVQPAGAVPALAPRLRRLAALTEMAPRDSIIHYTVWNPRGERERTFTRNPEESALIESVRRAFVPIHRAIDRLAVLRETPLLDPGFVPLCRALDWDLQGLVFGVAHALRLVSPEFFAQELRLYYDPLQLDGGSYVGAGAVQLPVFAVDHQLWSAGAASDLHRAHQEHMLPFALPAVRQRYAAVKPGDTLLDRVEAQLAAGASGRERDRARAGLEALDDVFVTLQRFRSPHQNLAQRAYKAEAGNPRAVGSGGAGLSILAAIREEIAGARRRVEGRLAAL